jgi:hypothetical protein
LTQSDPTYQWVNTPKQPEIFQTQGLDFPMAGAPRLSLRIAGAAEAGG